MEGTGIVRPAINAAPTGREINDRIEARSSNGPVTVVVPSIYSSARPELDWSSVYRHHTYMISSFVLALISVFKARRELVPADE